MFKNFIKIITYLLTPVFVFISAILFFYTLYKSMIIENNLNFSYFIQYYLLSFFFFSLALISFFSSNIIKINLALTLMLLFFLSYGSEYYLINKISESKKIILKKYDSKNKEKFDRRNKFQIYNDIKKSKPDIKVILPPKRNLNKKNIKIFPVSGISNKLTINCNENGYYSIFLSDRYGFNNPDSVWEKETIDYVLIGDSFVLGSCVNRPFDIASNFRNYDNNKYEVLNLGYVGNGPLITYASLKEYTKDKKIKNIIYFFYEENDLIDLKKEIKNPLLNKYINDYSFSQGLIKNQKKIDLQNNKTLLANEKRYNKKKFISFIKLSRLRGLVQPTSNVKKDNLDLDDEFRQIIKFTKRYAENKNSNIYFVYLPSYDCLKKKNCENTKGKVTKIISEFDVKIIDSHYEIFKKLNDPFSFFPFRSNGHFTIDGYKNISRHVYEVTKQK
jgi:hypothetical protein